MFQRSSRLPWFQRSARLPWFQRSARLPWFQRSAHLPWFQYSTRSRRSLKKRDVSLASFDALVSHRKALSKPQKKESASLPWFQRVESDVHAPWVRRVVILSREDANAASLFAKSYIPMPYANEGNREPGGHWFRNGLDKLKNQRNLPKRQDLKKEKPWMQNRWGKDSSSELSNEKKELGDRKNIKKMNTRVM